jgi:uncharacterized protein YndB with AHSA1/START domain
LLKCLNIELIPVSIITSAATSTKPSLTIRRRFNAPRTNVYAAWTDPEQMQRWFGPAGARTLEAQADVRVGGRFRVIFRTPDGEDHEVTGVYREVMADTRLVFTWAWRSTAERESLVTVVLASDGEGTVMTFNHEQFFDQASRDAPNTGWLGAFDKLEKFVASQGG